MPIILCNFISNDVGLEYLSEAQMSHFVKCLLPRLLFPRVLSKPRRRRRRRRDKDARRKCKERNRGCLNWRKRRREGLSWVAIKKKKSCCFVSVHDLFFFSHCLLLQCIISDKNMLCIAWFICSKPVDGNSHFHFFFFLFYLFFFFFTKHFKSSLQVHLTRSWKKGLCYFYVVSISCFFFFFLSFFKA